jgi:hypothetical protein
MATPTDPLWQHLAGMTAAPFIPELHDDACDDTGCTGCRQPRSGIARLDVPAAQVAADVKAAADRRLAEGIAAEVRHLLDPLDHTLASLPLLHPELIPSDPNPERFA